MSDISDAEETLEDASTVLMVAPDVRGAPVRACAGLVANGGAVFDQVVGVTVGQSPSDWLDTWQRKASVTGVSLTCVDVDSITRSTMAETGVDRPAATVRTISDATDLQSLGETLSEIMADADEADDRVAVCIHSLSDLLGDVGQEKAFGFLCTLGNRAQKYDAVVYAHLDASAHEETTVELFSAVCDAVVEFNECVTIRTR